MAVIVSEVGKRYGKDVAASRDRRTAPQESRLSAFFTESGPQHPAASTNPLN